MQWSDVKKAQSWFHRAEMVVAERTSFAWPAAAEGPSIVLVVRQTARLGQAGHMEMSEFV
jgi:hypothetical protein